MPLIPLILTRPAPANAAFRADIPPELAARLRFIESTLIEIVPFEDVAQSDEVATAIFTSANGVRFAPKGAGRPAYCVGQRTTDAAKAAGWAAQFSGQTAAQLVTRLRSLSLVGPTVHYSGRHVRGDIAADLTAAGHTVHRVVLYDQRLMPLSSAAHDVLKGQIPVIVPLFSPRAAAHFATEAPQTPVLQTLCLSAAVAAEIKKIKGFEPIIAAEPTAEAMIDALALCLRHAAWVEGLDRQG